MNKAVALLLLVAAPVAAQEGAAPAAGKPFIKLPAQVQAQPGKIFSVKAETNLKWVRWSIPPGLERVNPEDTAYGKSAFVGYGPAGVYEFHVEGTLNDEYAEGKCVVFVGQPAPIPPTPPVPPPAPTPSDPLAVDLQKLYAADASTTKAADKASLADVYRTGAGNLDAFSTVGQLVSALKSAVAFKFGTRNPTVLMPLRQRLSEETERAFGAPTAPLSPEVKKQAVAYFLRIAAILDSLR